MNEVEWLEEGGQQRLKQFFIEVLLWLLTGASDTLLVGGSHIYKYICPVGNLPSLGFLQN